jgi:hypothetical protein
VNVFFLHGALGCEIGRNTIYHVRLEVFTALTMKNVIWNLPHGIKSQKITSFTVFISFKNNPVRTLSSESYINCNFSRFWRVLTLVYDAQNYWVFELYPSSGILEG